MSHESLQELRAYVMQATEVHNEALTTHKTAMERYVANNTPENEAAMWEAFRKIIEANDARVSLYTQFMTAREQESKTAND
ncbi:MAG: hypothetical protein QOG23_3341 [Blastocatellia bacterium]|jgi:hypothetical protein|nr:hypothetical protein [Blastocatellia bacterium]